jgi:PhnB protein
MTRPIPEGFHTLTPFLNVKGAAEAIEFYKSAFGAEELRRVEMPGGVVGHAELMIGTSRLFVEEAARNPPTQSSFLLYVEDVDAAWKRATEAGAEVLAPLGEQFWGDRWGLVGDAWGNRWGLATHIEDVPEDELRRRAARER